MCRHTEKGCEKELFDALSKIQSICDEIQQPMSKVDWNIYKNWSLETTLRPRWIHHILSYYLPFIVFSGCNCLDSGSRRCWCCVSWCQQTWARQKEYWSSEPPIGGKNYQGEPAGLLFVNDESFRLSMMQQKKLRKLLVLILICGLLCRDTDRYEKC